MRKSIGGLALLLAVGFGEARLSGADDAVQDPVALPGGVTDAAGNVGYFPNPKGGLVAVDLEKGDVLWASKDANKPLFVTGKKLLALAPEKDKANVLRIVALDTADKGKRDLESSPITLPEWAAVKAGLDHHDAGLSFSSRAQLAKGDLLLRWSAGTYYYGGAAPSPEILKARTKNESGVARVNLESGKVEKMAGEKMAAGPAGFVTVDKLPKEVQEVAKRENWQVGVVVGPRAYGQVQKAEGKPMGPFGVQLMMVQAVDLKTGKLLWERTFEEKRILPPPP